MSEQQPDFDAIRDVPVSRVDRAETEPLVPGKPPSSYARVTSAEAMAQEFTMSRVFKPGYVEDEVDDFIDRIWATLRRYEDNAYLMLGLVAQLENVHDRAHVREIAEKMREVITEWPTGKKNSPTTG